MCIHSFEIILISFELKGISAHNVSFVHFEDQFCVFSAHRPVFTELLQWPSGGTDEVNLKVVDAELPPDSRIAELSFLSFAGGAVSSL